MSGSSYHQYRVGDIVPFHFNAGIIVASFVVSFLGTVTTIELLDRRKVRSAWIQAAACSITFGLVGIFAMHYIGNRSIVMGQGQPSLQLMYSSGFTLLSSLIPLIALFLAFLVANLRFRGRTRMVFALTLCGVGSGIAIAGMHYTGNAAISSMYTVSYHIAYVVGAITLACVASFAALSGLFVLDYLWMSKLGFRLICALFLALTVCVFHYIAALGTVYRLSRLNGTSDGSTDTNVIIAAILCTVSIPACIAIVWMNSARRRAAAYNMKHINLAAAIFHRNGNILVTSAGELPHKPLNTHERTVIYEGELSPGEPTFLWLLQASYNWPVIARWLHPMAQHLHLVVESNSAVKRRQQSEDVAASGTPDEDRSALIKERFCVASAELAQDLGRPLEAMGYLHGSTMFTGVYGSNESPVRGRDASREELERGPADRHIFGNGQTIFLLSKVSDEEALLFLNKGYRFADLDRDELKHRIAGAWRAPKSYVDAKLSMLKATAFRSERQRLQGAVLVAFVLKPSVGDKKWEVLVQRHRTDRLPSVQLTETEPATEYLNAVYQFQGLKMAECLQRLQMLDEQDALQNVSPFLRQFKACVLTLQRDLLPGFSQELRFHARPVKMHQESPPSSPTPGARPETSHSSPSVTILAFHSILDIHDTTNIPPAIDTIAVAFSPISLFKRQQTVSASALHYQPFSTSFERDLVRSFGPKFSTAASAGNSSATPWGEAAETLKHKTRLSIPYIPCATLNSRESRDQSPDSSPNEPDREEHPAPTTPSRARLGSRTKPAKGSDEIPLTEMSSRNSVSPLSTDAIAKAIPTKDTITTGDNIPTTPQKRTANAQPLVLGSSNATPREHQTFVDELLEIAIAGRRVFNSYEASINLERR